MSDGPTIYARLMERATDAPRQEIEQMIRVDLEKRSENMSAWFVEQLREAYKAGVLDGYRDAVIELSEGRDSESPTTSGGSEPAAPLAESVNESEPASLTRGERE